MGVLVAVLSLVVIGIFWRQIIVGMGFALAFGFIAVVGFLALSFIGGIGKSPVEPVAYVAPVQSGADPFVAAGWKPDPHVR